MASSFSIADLPNYDPICRNCIKTYIKKHRLKKGDKILLPCQGIRKSYLDDYILSGVEDPEEAISIFDPVTWAKRNLDWICVDPDGKEWKRKSEDGSLPAGFAYYDPVDAARGKSPFHRPYQATMLRCTAKQKVSRIGRQCLTENNYISLFDGSIKSIKDLNTGDQIFSVNMRNNKLEPDVVVDVWASGKKPIYRIKTVFGHVVECSAKHPFWSVRGYCDRYNGKVPSTLEHRWISISEGLSKGDKIAVPQAEPTFGDKPLPDHWPEFLGYFLADGSASFKQSAKFTNTNQAYLDEFTELCQKLGVNPHSYPKGNGQDLIITNGYAKPNPIRDQLRQWGLLNITGPQKFIPQVLFSAPKEQLIQFFRRFWAADGYISTFKRTGRETYRTEIGVLQENELMIRQIQCLMWRFGVHGTVKREKGKTGYNWRYIISNKSSVKNFLINFCPIPQKEKAGETAFQRIAEVSDKFLFTEEDILWDRIQSIEYIGEQETYDIEVQKNHNFVANGVLTHNSGKTDCLAVFICWNIFTRKGYTVSIITPYQTQVEIIFKRMLELIKSNPELADSIKESKKSPNYYLELKNGAAVQGYTAGTKSNAAAGSVRGGHAQLLIFDEADMLSRADLDSTLAVTINFPEAVVWMSSTPTGKRESFYKTCFDPKYREFHYPSTVNPTYTAEKDDFFRTHLTELGYVHEITALFGEDSQGVYQKKYIEIGKTNYNYGDLKPQVGWIYSIGVDWNDNVGTVIRVTGFNPGDNNFYSVDRKIVKKDGWTQTAAVQEVVKLNRVWHPSWIYVDKGHGGCVGPETLIQLENEEVKQIKNVQEGDIVFSHDGYFHRVMSKYSAQVKKAYRIRPAKCLSTVVSDCHPFLTYRTENRFKDAVFDEKYLQWRTCKELDIKRDFIAIAKTKNKDGSLFRPSSYKLDLLSLFSSEEQKSIDWDNEFIWNKYSNDPHCNFSAKKLAKSFVCGEATIRRLKRNILSGKKLTVFQQILFDRIKQEIGKDNFLDSKVLKFYRYIDLANPDLHLVLGWYLSEGNLNPGTVEFSQKKKLNDFREVIDAADRLFPSISVYKKDSGLYRLFINGAIVVKLFEYLGGKHASRKRILPLLLASFDCKNIIKGILLGDGHQIKEIDGFQLSLTSFQLVFQLRQYFIDRGILPSLYFVNRRKKHHQDQLRIDISGTPEIMQQVNKYTGVLCENNNRWNRRKYINTENYILVPISQFEYLGETEGLIDLSIDSSESFSGNGFILHNTQGEILHGIGNLARKRGQKNTADSRLAEIVKMYDFGSAVEIKDLFTKQPVKKPAKPFLVESSVRCFEEGRIKYPESDTMLVSQLEGYYIVRRTDAGIPKYGFLDETIGDHDVDALNLSLVAFALEAGEFARPKYISTVKMSGYFGESLLERKEREEKREGLEERVEKIPDRTAYQTTPLIFGSNKIPAANTTFESMKGGIRIWSWPGFLRDEPPPKSNRKKRRGSVYSRHRRTNI